VGETAATKGGMRRGSASPSAKPLENQGLETPGEKTPRLLSYLLFQYFFVLLFVKKPGALHPVANATIKALTCFFPLSASGQIQAIPIIERDGR
jgi:hypothetical protein